MGKGKAKKKAKPIAESTVSTPLNDQDDQIKSSTQAMDGHNVDGWTAHQIKAYNELLIEREKLVKQRKELEQRSAKSQAGRALLDENVANLDSVFEQQKTVGNYKFTGENRCCVDIDSQGPCHHEICKRAKTKGLTYTELESIRYYYTRIFAERSARKRDALRKQRDLELTKIKSSDDAERAKTARRSTGRNGSGTLDFSDLGNVGRDAPSMMGSGAEFLAGATKETQRLVTNILEQLDHLRSELQNGRITSSEMQKQLDIIDEEMRSANLHPSNQPGITAPQTPISSDISPMSGSDPFQNSITQRLVSGKGDTYTKAFHIMEHFLRASKPGDFQQAVADLKSVLGLCGPMCDELQNSFDALEGIFDNPDRLSFTGPDGKQECTSIIDLMEKMKETLRRTGELPEGANADLTRVFQQCIELEDEGSRQLEEEYVQANESGYGSELSSALSEIRASIVSKSPIPPLTEKVIEEKIVKLLAKHDVIALINKVRQGIEIAALDGHLTSMVMSRAKKDPEKCITIITSLASTYDDLQDLDSDKVLGSAFPRVKAKIESFISRLVDKKLKESSESQQPSAIPLQLSQPPAGSASDGLGALPHNTVDIVAAAMDELTRGVQQKTAHVRLRKLIKQHAPTGLWPIWTLYSHESPHFFDCSASREKFRHYEDDIERILSTHDSGLEQIILFLYDSGICPSMAATIVTKVLAGFAEVDALRTSQFLHQLSSCVNKLHKTINSLWRTVFQRIALSILRLYVALHVNATSMFESQHSVEFALSTVAMVMNSICLVESSKFAFTNLKVICAFVSTCMSPNGIELSEEVTEALEGYEVFCQDSQYRCFSSEPCSKHFPAVSSSNKQLQQISLPAQPHPAITDRQRDNLSSTRQAAAATCDLQQTQGLKISATRHMHAVAVHDSQGNPQKRTFLQAPVPVRDPIKVFERAIDIYFRVRQNAAKLMLITSTESIEASHLDSARSGLQSGTERHTPAASAGDRLSNQVRGPNSEASQVAKSKFSELIDEQHDFVSKGSFKSEVSIAPLRSSSGPIRGEGAKGKALIPESVAQPLSSSGNRSHIAQLATKVKTLNNVAQIPPPAEQSQRKDPTSPLQNDVYQEATHKASAFRTGHQVPESGTIFDLVRHDFYAFERYAAYLATEGIYCPPDRIKALCDEIYDSVNDSTLSAHSSTIQEFAHYAALDWKARVTRNEQPPILISTPAPDDPHQYEIISRLHKFLANLQDLELTKNELVRLGNNGITPDSTTSTPLVVFDSVIDGLEQSKALILDIATRVAKDRDMPAVVEYLTIATDSD